MCEPSSGSVFRDFKNLTTVSKENQIYELFDNINKNQVRIVSLPMVRSEKH